MKVLIDTQVLIWLLTSPERLRVENKAYLQNSQVFVSIASLWEITVKLAIKKLTLGIGIHELFDEVYSRGISLVNIQRDHLKFYSEINWPENHRDPFDRLLIATALAENMSLMPADRNFELYPELKLLRN